MARQSMNAFGEGAELVRVYLAATLAEAEAVEDALTAAGIPYAVEVESFVASTLLGSNSLRQGAGLWLLESDLDPACAALDRIGLVKGLVDRG